MKKVKRMLRQVIRSVIGMVMLGMPLSTGHAEPRVGFDFLALQHTNWPCDASIVLLSRQKEPSLGMLWGTFGESDSCLQRFLALPKKKFIRVHLVNAACIRNKRCGPYELASQYSEKSLTRALENEDPALVQALANRARQVGAILKPAQESGTLECAISPFLEHNLSERAATVASAIVRAAAPHCMTVDNPENSHASSYPSPAGTVRELHHAAPPKPYIHPCIASLDGEKDTKNVQVKFFAAARLCSAAFLWEPSFNCTQNLTSPFQDPRARSQCVASEYLAEYSY